MFYTEEQVKCAFWTRYFDDHQTYVGVEDAYEWWRNPLQKCWQEQAGRGAPRCKKICVNCRKHANDLPK